MMSRNFAVLAALLLASSCGGVRGPDYRGEPLATVTGQLTPAEGVDTSRGVRLAVAWSGRRVTDGDSLTPPRAIVTEDVVYRGSFPVNYAFELYKPPPPEALGPLGGAEGGPHVAFGFLLAYVDENGNGELDTIPRGGAPVDTVLGSSWEYLFSNGFGIAYLDQPGTYEDANGLKLQAGFNLVDLFQAHPLSTPVPIPLTGAGHLNRYVCEELWEAAPGGDSPCQLAPAATTSVGVLLELDERWARAQVSVWDLNQNEAVTSARVTLDGVELPESPWGYELVDDTRALLVPGESYRVRVELPDGGAPLEVVAEMPQQFAITSPAESATLPSGSALQVAWSKSGNADYYEVSLEDPFGSSILDEVRSDVEQFTSAPVTHTGEATLKVRAIRYDGSGSYTTLTREVPVTFGP